VLFGSGHAAALTGSILSGLSVDAVWCHIPASFLSWLCPGEVQAHEAQAGKLAEAALRAVAARSEVVRENAALAQQLAQAQNVQATYAQQLLPLLATYGLTAPASDPHAVTSNVAVSQQTSGRGGAHMMFAMHPSSNALAIGESNA
jgi:hypothetical protein